MWPLSLVLRVCEGVAAAADHGGLDVVGVNTRFHVVLFDRWSPGRPARRPVRSSDVNRNRGVDGPLCQVSRQNPKRPSGGAIPGGRCARPGPGASAHRRPVICEDRCGDVSALRRNPKPDPFVIAARRRRTVSDHQRDSRDDRVRSRRGGRGQPRLAVSTLPRQGRTARRGHRPPQRRVLGRVAHPPRRGDRAGPTRSPPGSRSPGGSPSTRGVGAEDCATWSPRRSRRA